MQPQITHSKPNVATNSLSNCGGPDRRWIEIEYHGCRNIR